MARVKGDVYKRQVSICMAEEHCLISCRGCMKSKASTGSVFCICIRMKSMPG